MAPTPHSRSESLICLTFSDERDLDFFGLTPDAVDRLVPAVDRALQEAGLVVHHIQENPGFARLIVESGDDRTELDLGADARLFPAEPGRPAPMLSGEELAVDKLAVFGRAEGTGLRRPRGGRSSLRPRSAL